MEATDRILWREPYDHTRRDVLRQIHDTGLMSPITWIRSILLTVMIALVIFGLMRWVFPGMLFPWLQILGSIVMGSVFLLVVIIIFLLVPRFIEVHREWLQVTHGGTKVRINRAQLDRIEIIEEIDTGVLCLVVEYRTRRGKKTNETYAIAESVDLEELRDFVEILKSGRGSV